MKKESRKFLLFILTYVFVIYGQPIYSQERSDVKLVTYVPDLDFSNSISILSLSSDYTVRHHPTKKDIRNCKKYLKLINREPTQKNHANFYALACSLWEVNKLQEAEKLFLKIITSKEPYYETTYYHASDISGNESGNNYGYGSFTSNYKNGACCYLAKIYIQEKKFDEALKYLNLADKKYTISYNSGTVLQWYQREIKGLYCLCYEGLGKNDHIINIGLSDYFDHNNGVLIRAIKRVYTQKEINDYLRDAENSIVCKIDEFQSSSFITTDYGKKNETTTEIRYTSGTARMTLFGKEVTLPIPDLVNGEIITKEHFVKNFKESAFVKALTTEN